MQETNFSTFLKYRKTHYTLLFDTYVLVDHLFLYFTSAEN